MKVRATAPLVMALCLAVGSASASSIGIFFDAGATDCDASVQQNQPFTIFIIAILGGDAAANGIIAARYRMTGHDPNWFMNYQAGPGSNLALGAPYDGTGANVAWPNRQRPGNGMLELGRISVFNPGPPSEHILRIEATNRPTRRTGRGGIARS